MMKFKLKKKSRDTLAGADDALAGIVEKAIAATGQDFTVEAGDGGQVELKPYTAVQGGEGWHIWFRVALAMRAAAIEAKAKVRWGAVPDRDLASLPDDLRGIEAAVSAYDNRQRQKGKSRTLHPERFTLRKA